MSWLTNKRSAANAPIQDGLGWPSEWWPLPMEEVSRKSREIKKNNQANTGIVNSWSTGGVASWIRNVCVSSKVNSDFWEGICSICYRFRPLTETHWCVVLFVLSTLIRIMDNVAGGRRKMHHLKNQDGQMYMYTGISHIACGSAPSSYYKWPCAPLWRPDPQWGLSDWIRSFAQQKAVAAWGSPSHTAAGKGQAAAFGQEEAVWPFTGWRTVQGAWKMFPGSPEVEKSIKSA